MKKQFLFLALVSSILVSIAQTDIYKTISVVDCDSLILAHFADPNFFIIDVRTASEYSGGHLYNSINIDYRSSNFSEQIATLDSSATYLVHCQSGGRSAGAMNVFRGLGFDEVYEMQGGFRNWTGRSTTTNEKLLYRYVNADTAYEYSTLGAVKLVDITHTEAYDSFNISNSAFISHEEGGVADSIGLFGKTEPLLLYSSCNENLDSIFKLLFLEGYNEVYYFNKPIAEWVDAGYEYNTTADTVPIVSTSIVEGNAREIQITPSAIVVEGTGAVTLLSISGRVVDVAAAEYGRAYLKVPEKSGVYIIQVGNESFKIAVQLH